MTLANGRTIGRVKKGDVDRLRFLLLKRFNYSIETKEVATLPALVDLIVDFPTPTKDGLDRAAAFVQGFLDHDEPGPKTKVDTVAAYRGAGGAIREATAASGLREERRAAELRETSIPKIKAIGGAAKSYGDATRLLVERSGSYAGFQVVFVPEGKSGRRTDGGPLIPGPWADAFALSAVVSASGSTRDEIAADERRGLLVRAKIGDLVDVEGMIMKIEAAPNRSIKLTPSAS